MTFKQARSLSGHRVAFRMNGDPVKHRGTIFASAWQQDNGQFKIVALELGPWTKGSKKPISIGIWSTGTRRGDRKFMKKLRKIKIL